MSKEENNSTVYTTVNVLMEKYSLSRPTIIKWAKEDGQVRYFQKGSFLRIHQQDFDEMIERKVVTSMSETCENKELSLIHI